MVSLIRYPSVIFLVSLFIFWFSARIGVYLRKWTPNLDEEAFKDLDVIATSTLTLLGLIIGFSFSMAISRYDQRKNYEEEEANAIGTEYLRVDLLPTADAGKARTLLRDYLDQRILFYETRDEIQLLKVNATTSQMQDQLWSAVRTPAAAAISPTALHALSVSGMNDVINTTGYTQAAWLNRIPLAAWGLMGFMAICSNVLVSFCRRRTDARGIRFLILPLILAIAFFAIADIDSPRRGVIRVIPENLISLKGSLH